jgi:excisionase family DNA binding protein
MFTVAQAARALNVSRWTVLRAIRRGEVKAERVGTHYVVIELPTKPIRRRELSRKEKSK